MREVHVSTMREAAGVYRWEVQLCVCVYVCGSTCVSEKLHVDFEGMLAPKRKSSV